MVVVSIGSDNENRVEVELDELVWIGFESDDVIILLLLLLYCEINVVIGCFDLFKFFVLIWLIDWRCSLLSETEDVKISIQSSLLAALDSRLFLGLALEFLFGQIHRQKTILNFNVLYNQLLFTFHTLNLISQFKELLLTHSLSIHQLDRLIHKTMDHQFTLRSHTHTFNLTSSITNSLPEFVFHFTLFKDSMMIWIGTAHSNPHDHHSIKASLANDWSCAVPPYSSFPSVSTILNSVSPSASFSQSLSKKLAQRFKQQVFVSFDIPSQLIEVDHQILFSIEKELFSYTQNLLNQA